MTGSEEKPLTSVLLKLAIQCLFMARSEIRINASIANVEVNPIFTFAILSLCFLTNN
jgi:hypothetical protein